MRLGPLSAWALLFTMSLLVVVSSSSAVPVYKYSTRVIRTKYGPLRGIVVQPGVEAYLGVPYATPPLGALRYMPPVTPSLWRSTRLADTFAPVCPQRAPDITNRTEALLELPRGRLRQLERLLPLLVNQSEDCLYLNLYVPRAAGGSEYGGGGGGEDNVPLLPCLVFVHGESYQWNSGNPYDGSVLAHHGQLIVVTLNFRLGILGFLKTGARGSAQGNFGLMDLVAGLHWLRENLPAFGGDPERITLLGHGTGAALANFIAVSPVAKELLHRVVLLSGSGLSPWALQKDPLSVKRRVAEQTGCHGDLVEDDLAPCLRTKSLSELMAVRLTPPRFLPGFAPFVDGTVLVAANPKRSPIPGAEPAPSATAAANGIDATVPLGNGQQGLELADFPDRDLLFGLASTESYLDLSAQDLEFGFNESRRDRILRTYVRNTYYYHLNEIFSTLKNEYTDWERPTQNPLSVRDATLEVLSDGHTAAPLIRVGYLHAATGGNTYFVHFHHQSGERDFPQRSGSVRGEDLPYVLGLPLVGGQPFFPHNYTRQDSQVSRLLMHYISNFARTGDPNGGNHGGSSSSSSSSASSSSSRGSDYQQHRSNNEHRDDDEDEGRGAVAAPMTPPFWDTYDSINQLYLELSPHPEMRSHYRGHKMSLWLNLIPQLHRPGGDDLSMRHHHFQEEGAQFYEGPVRPQTLQRPNAPPPNTASSSTIPPSTTSGTDLAGSTSTRRPSGAEFAGGPTPTTECPPNSTTHTTSTSPARQPGSSSNNNNNSNLLRKLANSHYQSYTTALTVTIAVGCFLLLLNILIFAGIYHQRDRSGGGSGAFGDKKKEELAEAGSCSSSSGDAHFDAKHGLMPMSASQTRLSALVELPLQEFKSSPPSGRPNCTAVPPGYGQEGCEDDTGNGQSPSIPEPPPPPKNQPPVAGGGILRQQGGSTTPGSMKKRVQIQEISV